MRRVIFFGFLAVLWVASGDLECLIMGSPRRPSAPPRAARWEQDLDYLARELPARQKDLYRLIPRQKFLDEIARLRGAVPELIDARIIVRLARLIAGLGVTHTSVRWPATFHEYPVTMYWFSDACVITAAAPEYAAALGARVLKIGALTPKQLEAALTEYLPHENEMFVLFATPSLMVNEEVLQEIPGVVGTDGSLRLTLTTEGGKPFVMNLKPLPRGERPLYISAEEAMHLPPPLCRKRSGFYWYEYLPAPRALYIQYNVCADDPKLPFEEFTRKMLAAAGTLPIRRVIVDLRFNGGGNSRVVSPLIDGLKERAAFCVHGRLYALIGRATFSSGLMAAFELREELHAILVGEPTGGKPNSYGEVKVLELPNSRLEVQYSVKYFRLVRGSDPPSLDPDIAAPQSFADFLAGRDPALDVALGVPAE